MKNLAAHIESILFVADRAVPLDDIRQVLEESFEQSFAEEDIAGALDWLRRELDESGRAIELVEINEGYQLLTRGAFHETLSRFLRLSNTRRLTRAALETLAIVAYRQPVTKTELEQIRGVNCDYSIQKLLEKDLVEIVGREEGPGRPLLYGTGQRFMDYFGLKSMADLPKPKEFAEVANSVGRELDIEEAARKEASGAASEEE